jgi:hypothetical protein
VLGELDRLKNEKCENFGIYGVVTWWQAHSDDDQDLGKSRKAFLPNDDPHENSVSRVRSDEKPSVLHKKDGQM